MCLSVPGQLIEIIDADQQLARVEVAGINRRVNLSLLPDGQRAAPGDWLLINTGLALRRISAEEAKEIQQLLEELTQPAETSGHWPGPASAT